jgi:hypothetical protein
VGSTIGVACRSGQTLLNTTNMQIPSGKAQALPADHLPASNVGEMEKAWKAIVPSGILWKHCFTAKVFLVGTRTFGFLTEVPVHALQDHLNSSIGRGNPCGLDSIH